MNKESKEVIIYESPQILRLIYNPNYQPNYNELNIDEIPDSDDCIADPIDSPINNNQGPIPEGLKGYAQKMNPRYSFLWNKRYFVLDVNYIAYYKDVSHVIIYKQYFYHIQTLGFRLLE